MYKYNVNIFKDNIFQINMLIYDNQWANLACFSFDSPSFTPKIPSNSNLKKKIVHALWLCHKK